jgi:hypothetical protein
LKQNEDTYSIYSKNILEEKDDVIKQLSFENIFDRIRRFTNHK